MKNMLVLASFLLTLPMQAAWAQKVYRCGSSYSQEPCPGGTAIEADDARSPEQRKARLDSAKSERRAGDKLEKNRLKEEAAAARAAREADKAEKAERAAALKAEQQAAKSKSGSSGKPEKIPAYRAAPATGAK